MTVEQLINAADKAEAGEHKSEEKPKMAEDKSPMEAEKQGHKEEHEGAAPQMANMDHHVKMNDGSSKPLKEMVEHYHKMNAAMDLLSAHHAKNMDKGGLDGGEKDAESAKGAQAADLTKRNADVDAGEQEAKDQEKVADKTKRNSEHFESLKNAHTTAPKQAPVDLDALTRGISRYGK